MALRRALLSEMKAMPTINEEFLEMGNLENPHRLLSKVIYQKNSDRIGHLSPEEAEAVSKFYSRLTGVQSLAEESDGFDENEDLEETITDLLELIESFRLRAIKELEKNSQ